MTGTADSASSFVSEYEDFRDFAGMRQVLGTVPIYTFHAGDRILAAGQSTGRLFILRHGSVEVVRNGIRIAEIDAAGDVFGELAYLLDQPHSADVVALAETEFYVADAASLLDHEPRAAVYVAAALADRVAAADAALDHLKDHLDADASPGAIALSLGEAAGYLGNADLASDGAVVDRPGAGGERAAGGADHRRRPVEVDAQSVLAKLSTLATARYEPGETVIAAGETSGKLLFLVDGLVDVVRNGSPIAGIGEPGALFGDLSFLRGVPHAADVIAVEPTIFRVADAEALLSGDPGAARHLATNLAGRLDAANGAIVEIRRQLESGATPAAIMGAVDRTLELLGNESFAEDAYLDDLITKPWGREYRVYADHYYDVWKLEIGPGRETSLHYHPRKDTILMCLSGHARIVLRGEAIDVRAGRFLSIPRGVAHSTSNVGDGELELIEVEHPRNKFDLIRMQDTYGRKSQPYEPLGTDDHQLPRMVRHDDFASAKYRPVDIYGRYHFRVLKSVDEIDTDRLILACLFGAHSPDRDIAAFDRETLASLRVGPGEHCFAICHAVD